MKPVELAQKAVQLCRQRGAAQAEALVVGRRERALQAFGGETALNGTSDTTRITLRVFNKHNGAIVSGRGTSEQVLESMVAQALDLSKQTSKDKFLGLADPKQLGKLSGDLGIFDQSLVEISPDEMQQIVTRLQSAVVEKDARLASLISSSLQVQVQEVALCTSENYCESYQATTATLGANAVLDNDFVGVSAEGANNEGGKLAAGSNLSSRTLSGLKMDQLVDRTISKLSQKTGARPASSGWFPVVFAPTAARSLASILLQFCSGPVAMYLEGSYFGKVGEQVCSPLITLVDDPLRMGGPRTLPFDHEGVVPRRKVIIEKGVFNEYLLNAYYGRSLALGSTGNAVSNEDIRMGVAAANAYIEAGTSTPESILSEIRQGFYVTRLMSRAMPLGSNFTQAATGLWIENGELTHAVRAAVISAPLRDTFNNIVACGDDVESDAALTAPTLMVSKMNISALA